MGIINKVTSFYAISRPAQNQVPEEKQRKVYRRLALESFTAATLGYSLYYVCRTTLNVMKEPIISNGLLSAKELGFVGSALLASYAVGKFVNGFIADYCNIKKFMVTGLLLSTIANLLMGIVGVSGTTFLSTNAIFVLFFTVWAVNGWGQSMGAPPAIISLSRWFPLSRRGTFYGFFSASHNLGEFFSFIFVGSIVTYVGWEYGFFSSAIAGVIGIGIVLLMLHDTPESKGLPSIEELSNEKKTKDNSTKEIQKQVLRTPAVWILAAASAFMYISRYSLNSWGVLFLQNSKGFSLQEASYIISLNALLGIIGTVVSGFLSDVLFKGNRNIPAFASGILLTVSYTLFIYGGNGYIVNVVSMVLFGIAIGVLICFLGGLMAVDIVPRKATGAALGVVGMASYAAAALQDIVSGYLIDMSSTEIISETGEKVINYDFSNAAIFWIGSSIISFLLPVLNWNKKVKNEEEN